MQKRAFFPYIFSIVFLSACNNTDNSLGILDPDATNDGHLHYFGFTLIDTLWDDPTDTEAKSDYSDEVASFSNIADILVLEPSDNVTDRIRAKQQLEMKSVLHIANLFFEIEGTNAPSGTDYALRTDYQERWSSFTNINELAQNQESIEALYLGEEPTWNGISAAELKQAADYIKATAPKINIMIIEAYPAIDDLRIPTSVDWIGFDHYFIEDPANDPTFLGELETLKAKLRNNQKLVLVMDTHYIDFAHGDFGGIELSEMGNVANSYYTLAKAETKVVALLGYFWPSGFDRLNAIGARHMPDPVKNDYIRIGKEITGKE